MVEHSKEPGVVTSCVEGEVEQVPFSRQVCREEVEVHSSSVLREAEVGPDSERCLVGVAAGTTGQDYYRGILMERIPELLEPDWGKES